MGSAEGLEEDEGDQIEREKWGCMDTADNGVGCFSF